MVFWRDTRHLWLLLLLLVLLGTGFVFARQQLVPATFGEGHGRYGSYRAAAIAQIAEKRSEFVADSVCHECHQAVEQERAESLHKVVRCAHCHGIGTEHVLAARQAAKNGSAIPAAAHQGSGNLLTDLDLYITKDRVTCLVCHEKIIGRPDSFRTIDVQEHLETQGAEAPEKAEVCFECHGGHNTKP